MDPLNITYQTLLQICLKNNCYELINYFFSSGLLMFFFSTAPLAALLIELKEALLCWPGGAVLEISSAVQAMTTVCADKRQAITGSLIKPFVAPTLLSILTICSMFAAKPSNGADLEPPSPKSSLFPSAELSIRCLCDGRSFSKLSLGLGAGLFLLGATGVMSGVAGSLLGELVFVGRVLVGDDGGEWSALPITLWW